MAILLPPAGPPGISYTTAQPYQTGAAAATVGCESDSQTVWLLWLFRSLGSLTQSSTNRSLVYTIYISKFIKKTRSRELRALYRVACSKNRYDSNNFFDRLHNYSHDPDKFWDPNFKLKMCSNDILNDTIATKAVTDFKFLFNWKFRSCAFRNCAYFVMLTASSAGCRLSQTISHDT